MDNLKKNLEQREKSELIAIITHMLRQEPDLQWLLTTPLPTAASREVSIDPKIYQRQIVAAMSVNDNQRKHKRGEVQRRLTAIKTIADELVANENYAAALTIYEVLVNEVIHHFNDYRAWVLPSDMVDNSTNPCERILGWFYPHSTARTGHFIL